MGGKNTIKSCKKYTVCILLLLFLLEIIFNQKNISLKIVLDFFISIEGIITALLGTQFLKRARILIVKSNKRVKDVIKNRKANLSSKNLLIFCAADILLSFLYPIAKNRRNWTTFLTTIFITFFLATFHPYGKLWIVAKAAGQTIEKLLNVSELENFIEKPDESNTEEPLVDFNMNDLQDSEEEKSESNNNSIPDMKNVHFWLKDNVLEKDQKQVRALILYEEGTYEIEDSGYSAEEILKVIQKQFHDIDTGEPTYLEEIFPIAESSISESKLYEMEKEFFDKITYAQQFGVDSIPDNSDLDRVIQGRVGEIRRLQSNKMASALANNYLEYVLEYDRQKKISENRLYYSGMAILAAQLEWKYSKTEAEKSQALNWICERYREIKYMGLVENIEKIDLIIKSLESLQS